MASSTAMQVGAEGSGINSTSCDPFNEKLIDICGSSNCSNDTAAVIAMAKACEGDTTMPATAEINHVLNDFNRILDSADADLEYEIHDLNLTDAQSRDFIVKSMENLSDMLLGVESRRNTEGVLVIVETGQEASDSDNNANETETPEPDEFVSCEEGDQVEVEEEGYESDRPMMGRASMRRLKPIPMPANSTAGSKFPAIQEVNEKRPSTQSSSHSVANMILVTSLINNPTAAPAVSESDSVPDHVSIHEPEDLAQHSEHSQPSTSTGYLGSSELGTINTVQRSSDDTISSAAAATSTSRSPSSSSSNSTTIQVEPTSLLSCGAGISASGPAAMETSCSSPATTETSSGTSTSTSATPVITRTTVIRHANRSITIPGQDEEDNNNDTPSANGRWPHRLSSMLALLGCTLGLNNICRFSLLSVQYGANFTLQFLILSIIIGLPLFTFHMSIGQYLNSGIVDMWKISPIFQGIGIGLVISQAMIGIYTAVGVSWMFIYFRDSFITKFDQYRWGKCLHDYRGCDPFSNNTSSLAETVPDYFNGVVLQRSIPDYPTSYFPTSLKFTVAFNLAVVWMLVFVSLSKGLKSYGKVIHGFVLIPIICVLILASKMVGIVPTDESGSLFGQTDWTNFFFNSQTWVLAAREAFFTWGILGACIMQITSHNRYNHSLKSDASIVILITTFVLFLSAFIGNACYSILQSQGYFYVPSSFESMRTYEFLVKKPPDFPPNMQMLPTYMNQHTSFLMGVRIMKPEGFPIIDNSNLMINTNSVSGYQALRVATELYPATMAVLGSAGLSPFWTVLFYFTCILFGIAQQLAIWHTIIKGVTAINAKMLKSWETTITFFVCALGFGLGLPLCTELGIFIIYFLDYCIGSGWWIMVLYLLELVAVFVVRGAPYCGENIVTVFMTGNGKFAKCFAPIISFVWNVILPVTMLVLSITSFKSGNVRELYDWSVSADGYVFWPSWTRELGSLIQLLPILMVPFVAVVQSCRYLTNGPTDLFDRMQELYRPHSRGLERNIATRRRRGTNENSSGSDARTEDPPPKYTPPPSYSTATSARIAKFLRASLRRSIRRISNPGPSADDSPPPPNYASVILEIHNQQQREVADNCCSTSANTLPTITVTSTSSGSRDSSTRLSNANDILLPILSPLTSASSSAPSYEAAVANSSTTFSNDSSVKPLQANPTSNPSSNTKDTQMGYQEFERSSLRRIASDITPNDVARILRATYQTAKSANNPIPSTSAGPEALEAELSLSGPFYDLSFDRHGSIDSDQFYSYNNSNNSTFQSTHCRTSSFPRTMFYNNFIDFSRCSRRSNDSQIALILDPSRRESLASDILANEEFLSSLMATRQDGIVNPSFQVNNDEPKASTSSNVAAATSTAIMPSSSSSSRNAPDYSGSNSNCTVISKGLTQV